MKVLTLALPNKLIFVCQTFGCPISFIFTDSQTEKENSVGLPYFLEYVPAQRDKGLTSGCVNLDKTIYGKCSKFKSIFSFCFSNKMLVIRAGFH